ncbi:MAG: cadherin-like beta sandwich domain-containing protein [Treponema lecithinolyticum]|uniref:cadherin-like beta sandwich domain-containing protein n=1 Tax=Treponema lecithinolyticum TaxID=53418 RepID=UPI003FA26E00
MKRLQKLIYTILLFSSILIGCNQNVVSSSGGGGGAGADNSGWKKVHISVLDGNNQVCTLSGSGNNYFTTVKTEKATVSVSIPLGAEVKINGEKTRSKELTFAANGEQKKANVSVFYSGTTQNYEVTIRYYKGAIKKLTVKDEGNNAVPVVSPDAYSYTASIGTKKANITVETFDAADTVKIDGEKTKTKNIELAPTEKEKILPVIVTHEGNDENYTVKLLYSDPNEVPKAAVLKSITVKNAEAPAQTFALLPQFAPYNDTYAISVSNSVNKIKVEAEAETGIDVQIDGGEEHMLVDGKNVIKIKAVQQGNSANAYEYTINIQKAAAGASNDAFLKSLTLNSKWAGKPKDWKTPPVPFAKETYTYTCTMDAHCDEFFIKAEPEEAHAVMTVQANGEDLVPLVSGEDKKFVPKNGTNTFVITVTAQDASTVKTYTVTAEKKEGSYVLKNLTVSGVPDFYTGRYEEYKKTGIFGSKRFDVNVFETAIPVTVKAEPEFPASTTMKIQINKGPEKPFDGTQVVDFSDTWKAKGKPDTKDRVLLTIKLESSVTSDPQDTYYLWLYKKPATGGNDNTLKGLEVQYYGNGYKFYAVNLNETFESTKTDYSVTLPYGVQEIRVTATPTSEKAYIDGWLGSKTNAFFGPFDTVKIPVVAENGDRKVYEITVKQKPKTTIKINNITENQTIDLKVLPSGLSVTGEFDGPDGVVDNIWIGSSGLPIQKDKGGKWVEASINGKTFSAVLPLETLKELPNGLRDIKAGAFNFSGNAVAVTRVPVTVTGNPVATAPVYVTIKKAATVTGSIPANASMSIIALDQELWGKHEDVVYASKTVSPIGTLQFPTKIPLAGIKAGVECRVEVYIYERILNKDVLLYSGVEKVQVQAGSGNACTVELKSAQ